MEDVLDVYTRLQDPARPLVYLDETSKQLVDWLFLHARSRGEKLMKAAW